MGWFHDMEIVGRNFDDGLTITILAGSVSDQAALHGLPGSIRDLITSFIHSVRGEPS
jgi:hypothetical protein